jgi:hypothetical protein
MKQIKKQQLLEEVFEQKAMKKQDLLAVKKIHFFNRNKDNR